MAAQPDLFGRVGGRRRRGIARQQLDRTLLAWRRRDQLAGDDTAAVRSALRDAAEAVDAARDALRDPDHPGSPYTLAMCVRVYAELLERAAAMGAPDEDLAALLAGFTDDSPTAVRDPA